MLPTWENFAANTPAPVTDTVVRAVRTNNGTHATVCLSWTEDMVDWLAQAVRIGGTGSQIANAINVKLVPLGGTISRSAVIGQAHRSGLRLHLSEKRVAKRARASKTPRFTIITEDPKAATRIQNLSDHQCRYPVGDDGQWSFCGAPIMGDRTDPPYCAEHLKLCVPAAYYRLKGEKQ